MLYHIALTCILCATLGTFAGCDYTKDRGKQEENKKKMCKTCDMQKDKCTCMCKECDMKQSECMCGKMNLKK